MTTDQLLDVTGLRCPLPVIRLAKAARDAPAGTVITLLSTDPAAEPDVAAWCRMRGKHLLEQTWLDPDQPDGPRILRSRIRCPESGAGAGPAAPRPGGSGTPAG